jgi:dihydropteroate synthase
MHMLGEPRTMLQDPRYDDVVADVRAFLEERLAFAVSEGVAEECVWLDPGIGFGKTVEHNLELLRRLDEIVAIGRPVVIGTSRKSFLGKLAGGRDEGWRSSAGRACSACTTSPRTRMPSRWPLLLSA